MLSEFRFAARALGRWRGGAIAAVLTLAVGIGTTTALYAVVRLLLGELPGVPALDRLGRVYAANRAIGVERSPVALTEFDSSLSTAASFSAIGAYSAQDATLGGGPDVLPIVAGHVSPAFFTAMGVAPARGRVFSPADLDGDRAVAVVSDGLWRRHLHGADLSNAVISVDGVPRAVVGVMPAGFVYPFVGIGADVWLPLARAGRNTPAIVTVYARLRDGVTWAAAEAELAALSRAPGSWVWHAIPVASDVRSRALNAYAGALGPALLVLVIACVNAACLLLARGLARDAELAVRRALGATRGRIVAQLFTEHLVLAAVSGALGTAFAAVMLRLIGRSLAVVQPELVARLPTVPDLLPIALAVSAAACLLFGTVPAVRLSRRDVAAAMNGVPPAHRVHIAGYGARDAVVFAEVAAGVGLLVWTAMLFTLFAQIRAIRFTFPADQVVAVRVPGSDVPAVAARIAAIPGVARVGTSSGMIGGRSPVRAVADGAAPVVMSRVTVGADFFDTLGVPIVRGRAFDRSELGALDGVLVLSESAAAKLAPQGDALGMRVRLGGGPPSVVIGICRDAIDYGALSKAAVFSPPEVYAPYGTAPAEGVVLARVNGDAHAMLRTIASAAGPLHGARPLRPVVLGDEAQDRARQSQGGFMITRLLASFAILTLILAASGVFAVVNQSVAQRTREFGIRLAVGATPARVLRMVLAREAKLIAAAIGTGLVFAMAGTRALFEELAALNAIVPALWIGALIVSAAVSAAACALATCRIVRLDPAAVLRRT
ncbi:MAG TPA: ABC transporter permease [Vicinamibacterales bacterium]|nr:ABC transporter permease [Vicinamibacterales bacterium]